MTSGLTYPYTKHDRRIGVNLDLDLEFSPGPVPPSGTAGGAGRYRYWVDTTSSSLRQCIAARATAGVYVPAEWITLGVIDIAGAKFHFNTDNVDFTGGSGVLNVHDLTVSGATHLNTLTVTGASTLGTLTAGATTVSTLHATGATTLDSTLNVAGTTTLGALNAGAITGASLDVTGAINGATLGVSGAASLGSLTVGALHATGAVTLDSTLNVTGTTTLGTLNAGAITGAAITGASLGVSGAITGASLGVSGAITGASLGVSGAITGTTISGSTLSSSGDVSGASLNVTGDGVLGRVVTGQVFLRDAGTDYAFVDFGYDTGLATEAAVIFGPDAVASGASRIDLCANRTAYYKSDVHNFWSLPTFATFAVFNAGGTANQSGSWIVISDDTVKENVTPYSKGLAEILQLNPVSFNYYVPGSKREAKWSPFADPLGTTTPTVHYGLLASNVDPVLPEMVSEVEFLDIAQGLPSNVPLATIAPTHLVYVLTNAVKELSTTSDDLDDRLTIVEGHTPPVITLTGDITGSGTPTIATTLPVVNSNPGTFQGLIVNAKGLVTGASNMNYAPLASPVFTGKPTAPAPVPTDASLQLATTAFVRTGTTTNDDAPAGQVGEYLTAQVLSTSGIALTNNVDASIITLSLGPGDWLVFASAGLSMTNGNGITFKAWINPTGGTAAPSIDQIGGNMLMPVANNIPLVIQPVSPIRIPLAATTAVRFGMTCTIGGGTVTGWGKLIARRMR